MLRPISRSISIDHQEAKRGRHAPLQLDNALGHIAVTYRAPSELVIQPNSPRLHTPHQIRQIARSIRTFGFVIPIIIDETHRVLAGAGRLQAACDLDYAEVPTIQVKHLSEDQKTAFVIADNQLAAISKWNDPVLAAQLKALSVAKIDFDIEVTGFEAAEIDLRIEQSIDLDMNGSDPVDALPAIPAGAPVTQTGDLWILGRHRLLCGNALEPVAYATLMNGEPADLVFADPPYNVPIDGHATGKGAARHREFAMAAGEMSAEEFETFLQQVCTLLVRHSVDGSIHYICIDWRHAAELLAAARGSYTEYKNLCVWAKTNAGMGSLYRSQYELVAVFKNGTAPHCNNVQLGRFGRHRSNLWTYPGAIRLAMGTKKASCWHSIRR
ncbi:ParB N-terminal domain-containing protein [Bradyrhizobium sp. CCGUVB23]|uniref:DNA methyltransferase n=1 Tax=Bradyrhizobium sp. CCGUVB23 TaxID=2949630 RepID=UPI0020B33D5C|nr:ParB N-terminal domain-containing protein [Bradyrhizobium sp. CCGUVB23]MCP3460020.1 site-specific DNA-methyltransferase [Bradyrhizobium sp. CCGUVB23]